MSQYKNDITHKYNDVCLCIQCQDTTANLTLTHQQYYENARSFSLAMTESNSRFKVLRKQARRRSRQSGNIVSIPPINNSPIQTRCLRYQGNIVSTTDFRVSDFTTMLVATTNSSNQGICLFEAVRLQEFVITCLPNSTSNAGSLGVTWAGEREPHTTETIFYAMGTPSRWRFTPPEGSLASFWFTQDTSETSSTVLKLNPSDSVVELIVDIHFQYVIADGASDTITLSPTPTFTGVAARVMPGGATDELFPVGINYVTS